MIFYSNTQGPKIQCRSISSQISPQGTHETPKHKYHAFLSPIDGDVKLIPDYIGDFFGISDWFQDNELVLDDQQAFAQMAMEENCEKGNCKDMPPTMKLTIRAAYGSAFLKGTKNNKRSAAERVKKAVCHAQARYCHSSSLGTKIQAGPSGRVTHFVDIKVKVSPQYKLLIHMRLSEHVSQNTNKKLLRLNHNHVFNSLAQIIEPQIKFKDHGRSHQPF